MDKILVSFTVRPGEGSEGGVGWAFVEAAARRSLSTEEQIHLVFDERDLGSVLKALPTVEGNQYVNLVPVSVPRYLLRRYGMARRRETYLGWAPRARATVKNLLRDTNADVTHQVTFATGVLPPAFPRNMSVRTVWGPLSVPLDAVRTLDGKISLPERAAGQLGRALARINMRGVDLVVATNEMTRVALEGARYGRIAIEPNVVVSAPDISGVRRDSCLISMVGLLNDRKRPWLAIRALKRNELSEFRMQIIGDGPLREQLEGLVRDERLQDRVTFTGRRSRNETLRLLAGSRLLVHPAAREGAAWVVGEAASVAVPAVVFAGVGAATTVRLSNNGGVICRPEGDLEANLAEGMIEALRRPIPEPSSRWDAERLPALLDSWWRLDDSAQPNEP